MCVGWGVGGGGWGVGLQVLIGEEFSSARTPLKTVVSKIADVVVQRAAAGKHFGLIIVPEVRGVSVWGVGV